MQRTARIFINLIFFFQVLLVFLLFFEERIELPGWLQVAGRLHPMVLHVPIGILILLFVFMMLRNTFRRRQFRKIVLICLLLAALSASVTALFGLFLSINGDYGTDSLRQHIISGVVLSMFTFFLLVWYKNVKKGEIVFYSSVVFTLLALVFAGHTGSVLTHGENFVLAPIATEETLTTDNASLYQLAVMPVLEKKCFSCHNESKAKGKLIMTSMTKFKAGGEHGRPWVEGNPDSSRMIQNLHLPLEHDDHMPPDGKPQLSTFEISLLEAWILAGADFEKKMNDFAEGDTLKMLATSVINSRIKSVATVVYPFNAVSSEVIGRMNTPFRTVFPLYQNSPALHADFFVKESFQLSSLEQLKEIKDQLVVLNLSKMPVTDANLSLISQFKNLEKLNLNFTGIKGEGLINLKSLTSLESISLSGTSVTKDALTAILSLPALREVFIWNTPISEAEKTELEKSFPKIEFIHTLFNDSSLLALSKPILINEGIIRKGDFLQLKHTMPGVAIRYSLDGSNPDSISSTTYDKPIPVWETVKLKALACKEGWYCSDLLEITCYVEGHTPAQVTLLKPADKQYPGEGASSLTDGRKGFTDVLKEPSWLGFRENAFEAGFDFGSLPPSISKIVLSYADNLGGYIFPPTDVEVWGGKNANEIKLIKAVKIEQPTADRPQSMEAIGISFDTTTYAYYKIVAKPLSKLPLWHGGKGQKGWFFVDEVFFY
ncbi:MAG: chitobiase/beta-hexosaminidase C-terminal domain-containing protein [Cyclobacteriaceae bacterium]